MYFSLYVVTKSKVIQARKCIACLNRIFWSKDKRKERKLNIYNVLIKSSLLCGSETLRLTENNKRRVEATGMDALRRSSRTAFLKLWSSDSALVVLLD